jgi:hypothetical protein
MLDKNIEILYSIPFKTKNVYTEELMEVIVIVIVWVLNLQLPMINTKVVSLNSAKVRCT